MDPSDRIRTSIDAVLDRVREQLRRELDDLVRTIDEASAEQQAEAARAARVAAEAAANAFVAEAIAAERASAGQRVRDAVDAARQEWLAEHERALDIARDEARAAQDQALDAATARLNASHADALASAAAAADAALITARATDRQAELATTAVLLDGIRTLDEARSLSAVLDGLVELAGSLAPRAALLVVRSGALKGWGWRGFASEAGEAGAVSVSTDDPSLVGRVWRSGSVESLEGPSEENGFLAPLPADRAALAMPVRVDGHVVGVLYADDDVDGARQTPSAWPELVEVLVRHAGRCLEATTARRLPDLVAASAGERQRLQSLQQEEDAAQRYARLLVSEIKLYHEAAVEEGRRAGDLARRLRPQIERAQQLYEERVPPVIRARSSYFEDELVRTLADGHAALLGQAT